MICQPVSSQASSLVETVINANSPRVNRERCERPPCLILLLEMGQSTSNQEAASALSIASLERFGEFFRVFAKGQCPKKLGNVGIFLTWPYYTTIIIARTNAQNAKIQLLRSCCGIQAYHAIAVPVDSFGVFTVDIRSACFDICCKSSLQQFGARSGCDPTAAERCAYLRDFKLGNVWRTERNNLAHA